MPRPRRAIDKQRQRLIAQQRNTPIEEINLSERNNLCAVEGKVKFNTREDVLESVERSDDWRIVAPYLCMECFKFHKTSDPKTVATFYRELDEGLL